MVTAGAYNDVFHNIGFECDSLSLGKGCPSQQTINWSELNLAADCLIKVLQEIKDDGTKHVGIITDHLHRGGRDHFVVVIFWAGKDSKGNKTSRFFYPSIDRAGYTAQMAADGIKNVMERFLDIMLRSKLKNHRRCR